MDFTAPTVIRRRPAAGRRGVSRRARISVRFSEPVSGVSARTLTLIGPSGRKIRATVKYDAKRRRARLAPAHRLRRHRKYTVRLTRGIVDRGRNSVPVDERTWQFRTGG